MGEKECWMFFIFTSSQQRVFTFPTLAHTQFIEEHVAFLFCFGLMLMNANELVVFLCVFFGLRQNHCPTSHFFSSQSHRLLLAESIYNVPDSPYFNKVTLGTTKKKKKSISSLSFVTNREANSQRLVFQESDVGVANF